MAGAANLLKRDVRMGRSGIDKALQSVFRTEAQLTGVIRRAVHVGDVAMAERNQVFESRMHAQLVVNAHRAVKSDGGRGVDADERHVHVFQTTDLIRVDVERADDDRVHIATNRQFSEEIMPFPRVRQAVYGDVVSGRAEYGIEPAEDIGIEPDGNGIGMQECDAERLSGFQRGRRPGDLEVEFACGGEDSVTCLRQHKIRLGEGS